MNNDTNVNPLRQRMIDDMNMRKFTKDTQSGYLLAIKRLSHFLGKSLNKSTKEDLRLFQLHLVDSGATISTINSTVSALRFFFKVTLDCPEVVSKICHVPVPRRLPLVLTVEEVTRLIDVATPKYRAAFAIAYGAGLRISEIVQLKISDIDSQRMIINVIQGKGSKDRYALLSEVLLEQLRDWWRYARKNNRILKGGWLFPGQNPVNHMSNRQLSRACTAAAKDANIEKHVTMHLLRHSFATHLLEQHVDIRVIQVLLGHAKLSTTAIYAQVATNLLKEVISPIESLTTRQAKKTKKTK
mgnify:CR=1 FL=1